MKIGKEKYLSKYTPVTTGKTVKVIEQHCSHRKNVLVNLAGQKLAHLADCTSNHNLHMPV